MHLYNDSELDWHLENGTGLKVAQKTNYPWDGRVDITVAPAQPSDFTFHLRIPGWAKSAQVSVNNTSISGIKPGQYLPIERKWSAGDVIRLHMEMPPQVIQANPRVIDDAGRVAVQRGPLVYCLEELDQPDGVSLVNVALDLAHPGEESFRVNSRQTYSEGLSCFAMPGEPMKMKPVRGSLLDLQWSSDQEPPDSVNLHSLLRLGQSPGNIDAGLDSALQGLIFGAIRKQNRFGYVVEARCCGTQLQLEGGGFAGVAP